MGEDAQALGGIIAFAVIFFVGILFFICALCSIEPPRDTADAELSLARALAAYEALAAARAEAIRQSEQQAVKPPLPVHLPYFPYAASSETAECAICLEPLLTGQLCSEVPACRHAFHRDCLGEWAKNKGSCPVCRARIVPGLDDVAVADDMV